METLRVHERPVAFVAVAAAGAGAHADAPEWAGYFATGDDSGAVRRWYGFFRCRAYLRGVCCLMAGWVLMHVAFR